MTGAAKIDVASMTSLIANFDKAPAAAESAAAETEAFETEERCISGARSIRGRC